MSTPVYARRYAAVAYVCMLHKTYQSEGSHAAPLRAILASRTPPTPSTET